KAGLLPLLLPIRLVEYILYTFPIDTNCTSMKRILITGGAGFIGSHLCDELLKNNYSITVLDNLSEQVHGKDILRPEYLDDRVHLVKGDVRDAALVEQLVKETEAVYHFAALVGVGQSMYEIKEYTDVNNVGTATLLEAIIKHPVKKLVVASSMSIYGEGLYRDAAGATYHNASRAIDQLKANEWEVYSKDGKLAGTHTYGRNKKSESFLCIRFVKI